MASSRTGWRAAIVGSFVLGGILLAVLCVVFFGGGRFFEKKWRYVCYFPGSVNGLAIGAPVKFRGVPIGQVFDMRVRYHQSPGDWRIPVFIEVRVKRVLSLGAPRKAKQALLLDLVPHGLRAQLESESLVTGALFVNLDFFPKEPARFAEVESHGAYPEIPTVPTANLQDLTSTLREALRQVEAADLPGTIDAIRRAVNGVDRLVRGREVHAALGAVAPALSSVGRAADRVETEVVPLGSSAQATLAELQRTIATLNRAVADAGALVSPEGEVAPRLDDTLRTIDKAARAVGELAEFLRRNPNAVVVGRKR